MATKMRTGSGQAWTRGLALACVALAGAVACSDGDGGTGGTGGAGGEASGGRSETGGDETGGSETGGSETGGSETGGRATGGAATGGAATGGSGGSATGGAGGEGGAETGGTETGGTETGGTETGGSGGAATGGSETGGAATGGSETGGAATGGSETGGSGTGGAPPCDDADADTICDVDDECPGFDDLADADADDVPDGCDACAGSDDGADADADDVPDGCDLCPGSDDGADADADGVPDGCDVCALGDDAIDSDTDGVADACDACEGSDDAIDTDVDGAPDGCDVCPGEDDGADADADGVPDGCDVCAGSDDGADADTDGYPDGCDVCALGDDDLDTDTDGVPDACDACEGSDDGADADADGTPDACDGCGVGLTLSRDPLAFFRLADGADSSGNGNALTESGTLTRTVGVSEDGDQATSYASNDGVSIINPFAFPASNFTVSMWVKLEVGSPAVQYWMSYAVAGSDNEFILGTASGGNIVLYTNQGNSAYDPGELRDGTFHHVGVIDDGLTTKLYLDGVEVISRTSAPLTPGGSLVFGQEQDSVGGSFDGAQDFDGVLDEVVIYDEAFLPEELEALRASSTCSSESCATIKAADAGAADGYYWLDPDGAATATGPTLAYCDMTWDGGGWTLISSTASGAGPTQLTPRMVMVDGLGYAPTAFVTALANVSEQVHLRTPGAPDTESITSKTDPAENLPIVNLRAGKVLNLGSTMDDALDALLYWEGPFASTAGLWHNCALTTFESYPTLYWACGNPAGLHIVGVNSAWDYEVNVPLQAFVR